MQPDEETTRDSEVTNGPTYVHETVVYVPVARPMGAGWLWSFNPFPFIVALAALVVAAWALHGIFSGNNNAGLGQRVVTVQDFVKSRGINTSAAVPATYNLLPNGHYQVTLLRNRRQLVTLQLRPGQVNVVSGSAQQTTATLTYNFRPLYSVPDYVKIGDSWTSPRFNDPFGPHSGGAKVSQRIAGLNETTASDLVGWHLRLVTIRTSQMK